MPDNLNGRRSRTAFQKRAQLRKQTIADTEIPQTFPPHPLWQDLLRDAVITGGAVGGIRGTKALGEAAIEGGRRVAQRRVAQRAAAAASERRLAEMAAPRATTTFKPRGGGLITDVLGTPQDPHSSFEEGRIAAEELEKATMELLKKLKP